jgi:hypothetical protein
LRPAHGFKVRPAGVIVRETLEEGQQRHANKLSGQTTKVNRSENFYFKRL